MPFIINALVTLEIKPFVERRRNNGLCAGSSVRKAAHGAGMGLGRAHPEEGAFLGLCLPVRGLRESEHQSCAFVLLNPQVPIAEPPALVGRDFGEILSGSA